MTVPYVQMPYRAGLTGRTRLLAAVAFGLLIVAALLAARGGDEDATLTVRDVGGADGAVTSPVDGSPAAPLTDVPGLTPSLPSFNPPEVSIPTLPPMPPLSVPTIPAIPPVSVPAVPPLDGAGTGGATAVAERSTTVVTSKDGNVTVINSGSAVASTGNNDVLPSPDGSTPPVVTGPATAVGNQSTVEVSIR